MIKAAPQSAMGTDSESVTVPSQSQENPALFRTVLWTNRAVPRDTMIDFCFEQHPPLSNWEQETSRHKLMRLKGILCGPSWEVAASAEFDLPLARMFATSVFFWLGRNILGRRVLSLSKCADTCRGTVDRA